MDRLAHPDRSWGIPMLAVLLLLLVGARPAAGQVRLNEVCYDPAGPDAGREFVELYNAGPHPISLAGWLLEAGNGARSADWRLQWVGAATDRIGAAGFFLVAGEEFAGVADAQARLQLQNGPDAVRLSDATYEIIDLLGWGEHRFPEYVESAPATDAAAGWVLARVPDGADSDQNGADWVSRPFPTPGGSNAPDWCLRLLEIRCEPPLVDLGDTGRLQFTLGNCGRQSVDLGSLECGASDRIGIAAHPFAGELLAAGEIRTLECDWRPAGATLESLEVVLRDPSGDVRRHRPVVRCGRGEVLVSEICYDPAADEGEWIELLNRSREVQDLTGWGVSDASGQVTVLGPGPVLLGAGEYALIAETPDAFRVHWADLPPVRCLPRQGSWPGLNNSYDRRRDCSDEVCLRDARGHPIDYVRYRSGSLDGAGVTLERWIEEGRLIDPRLLVPCAQPAGATPGSAALALAGGAEGAGWLQPAPAIFYPDRPGSARYCRIAVPPPPAAGATVSADIYSLAGVRVATLVTGADASGPLALLWDGRDGEGRQLDSGLYLVRVVTRAAGAKLRRVQLRPVTLVRG